MGQAGGPGMGYFLNAKKCWLIARPCKEEAARELFAGTPIYVTTKVNRHLAAALGARSHLDEHGNKKVVDRVSEVTRLVEFLV